MDNRPTTQMINKYLVRAAASEAMDGAAPDLERDAPWREKQHARGTTCTHLVLNRTHFATQLDEGLTNQESYTPHFEIPPAPVSLQITPDCHTQHTDAQSQTAQPTTHPAPAHHNAQSHDAPQQKN